MELTLYGIIKHLLNEGVSTDEVMDAIANHNYVKIKYDDEREGDEGNPRGIRLIQPVAVGTTKKGNTVVRAFQASQGNSRRGAPKWKFFLLDRIRSWVPQEERFNLPPDSSYGEYNRNGDRSMSSMYMNAEFDDMDDTLSRVRDERTSSKLAPKVSVKKNQQGPIGAAQQWKKNVFTSQPNSQKYATYAKNIRDTESDIDRFNDDIWAKAQAEADAQTAMQNQAPKPNDTHQGPVLGRDYDEEEVDYDENNFKR